MGTFALAISAGEIRGIYQDEMTPYVRSLGWRRERASYVEPDDTEPGAWLVDLTKFGEGIKRGFSSRQAALDWEVAWLKRNWMTFIREPKGMP